MRQHTTLPLVARTFYFRLQLKRQGIELDKSELVEELLNAWVKWRQGEEPEIRVYEISPMRKGDKEEKF